MEPRISIRMASLRAYMALVRSWMSSTSKGGRWALSQPADIQRNLRNFWMDGLFANASESIIITYLTLYLLALGATGAQIGLMSSLASLSATLMLLPGAWLVERFGHRKWIAVLSGGVLGRLMLVLLVFSPALFPAGWIVIAAMTFTVLRDGFTNLGLPSWTSLTGDIVPIGWRGRYFASRNMVMGIGGMGVILAAGYLLNQMPGLAGYQVVLGLAFGLGMISTLFFTRLSETVQSPATPQAFGLVELIRTVVRNRGFLVFTLAAGVWNFSLNISVPFFSVFMAKGLLLDAGTIGALGIFANLAALPAQRWMGPLVDRFGPRRMQMITGFLIPALPFAWVFITEAWQIALLNVFSGALWAGFSLASFNMLLTMAPSDQMARYTALYQMVIAIALAAGAAFGSLVISYWSYAGVFILSAVGRLIGAILFSWLVPGDKSESVAASG